jgi:peptidyl-dipeptidase Dcp
MKPYFELWRVFHDGVLYAATQLYGLEFKPRSDLPVYHPTVRVYNVFEADGTTLVALLVVDMYARESKRGGAWMNQYQSQAKLLGTLPIIGIHCNVPEPPQGQPALIPYDEVRTMFHEFGHALHGILSSVQYPRFSGTNVPTDFVEFPSQVNEMWGTFPAVLEHYARHPETGAPMPQALVDKFKAAERFNEGYRTTEFLAAALLDQAWHQLTAPLASADDVVEFERQALAAVGLDFAPVPPRYRSTYFSHIFSTNSYTAKYCAYLWSEVLDAQAADWIRHNGGLSREVGEKLRRCVLSRGGSADPLKLFESFVDSEPKIQAQHDPRGLQLG